ncbi:MAG: UDP-N-acetylmuramyl-tripeptide synthetase [Candidatus Pacebacteria bacterium]|nr:UDP-N-acetylmuramyl-tripeptide synthetase [Candidatus Paceibacterota bacterium]
MLRLIKKIIPKTIFSFYHLFLSWFGALWYGFPSKKLHIVGITGTKGKTTTVELANLFLEAAGYTTAIAGTLRFKIAGASERNNLKMTMPGRFFIQRFLRKAVSAKCQYAIIEMSSEGAKQFRHCFIDIDTIIFTNLSPEHIESHGSYEKYKQAKLSIAKTLGNSKKTKTRIVVNKDDVAAEEFLAIKADEKYGYSIKSLDSYALTHNGLEFTAAGTKMESGLRGEFNLYNIVAAITFAQTQGIELQVIKKALREFGGIRGRVEYVTVKAEGEKKQNFDVIIDYAHTPNSLKQLYAAFDTRQKICVLGGTGGGRDTWKRPEMGRIVAKHCKEIILTNEDPYDEDPKKIIFDIAAGITNKKAQIILDRREAIRNAIQKARENDVILITGKGTDPYIMGPENSKIEWDDAAVAREELSLFFSKQNLEQH